MKVLELFAGVGGFRIGLEKADADFFETKWANQWEPGRKSQDAFEIYRYRFPNSENLNEDIAKISDDRFCEMDADLIVGGFPCQDYSVARSKKNEQGIDGKKGVLFWEIIRAVKNIRPKYLILENVDRLLKSPSKQRGRDFAIMLKSFDNLGYSVEWRVINAADYGRSQRRRRVFFFVYRNDTAFALQVDQSFESAASGVPERRYDDYIFRTGLFATQFPVLEEAVKARHAYRELPEDIVDVSNSFTGTVWNSGVMRHGKYYSAETHPDFNRPPISLGEVLQPPGEVAQKHFISDENRLAKFEYLRGPKKINRTSAEGHVYTYSEGGMSPHDDLSLPGRTMLTSEGTLNRSTHFIKTDNGYRTLTPVEAERLQDFPDDWTAKKQLDDGTVVDVSDRMRMFLMGNALVTEIVKEIGDFIKQIDTPTST